MERNDQCANAIPMTVNQIVRGTTVSMTSEGEDPCGDATASHTADVWYTVEGRDEYLFATTCTENAAINGDLDSQISVLSGNCGQLVCEGGNDDDMDDSCSNKAGVRFFAAQGSRYYLLVHGFGSQTGEFALQVKRLNSNDLCDDAVPLRAGQTVQGTTVGMMSSPGVPSCGEASESKNAVAWYHVVGDNGWLVATTCTENTAINGDYDTQISVFSGGCDDLDCVAGNDDIGLSDDDKSKACGPKSSVRFFARKETSYYVVVHGFEGSEGRFALRVMPQ
jgi:hypothetical protein